MTGSLRPLAAVAAVATVAVISAGCGGTSSAGRNPDAAARNNAAKFSECMRENGAGDFPDPNASGDFPDFGASVSLHEWRQAIGACKDLQPPRVRNPEQHSTALKFAQCIREHGVKDFPDPVNGATVVDRARIPSAATPGGTSVLNAAMDACRDLWREISAEAVGG
jgi:hypothetical protein